MEYLGRALIGNVQNLYVGHDKVALEVQKSNCISKNVQQASGREGSIFHIFKLFPN